MSFRSNSNADIGVESDSFSSCQALFDNDIFREQPQSRNLQQIRNEDIQNLITFHLVENEICREMAAKINDNDIDSFLSQTEHDPKTKVPSLYSSMLNKKL